MAGSSCCPWRSSGVGALLFQHDHLGELLALVLLDLEVL